jgi:hypothetical protein
MAQGVTPASPAGPGGSGPQQAAGAPAPQEATTAAGVSFGSDASGQDNRVPFARFKEVNDRMKGAEAKLAQYEAASRPTPAKGVDEMLAEIRAAARKGADDPDMLLGAIEQMVTVKTNAGIHEALRFVAEEQQKEAELHRFVSAKQSAQSRMFAEYPELQDRNSDLFKMADSIYSNDPELQAIPGGEYKAAQIAFGERAKKVARPAPLSSPGVQRNAFATPGAEDDYAADRASVKQAMSEGKMAAVDAFLTKHANRFLTKPTY